MTYPTGNRLIQAVKALGLGDLELALARGEHGPFQVTVEDASLTNRCRMVLYGIITALGLGPNFKVRVTGPTTLVLEPKSPLGMAKWGSIGAADGPAPAPVVGGPSTQELADALLGDD